MANGPSNDMPWSPEVKAQIEQTKQILRDEGDECFDAAAAAAVVASAALGESAKSTSVGAACAPGIDMSTKVVVPLVVEVSKEGVCKPAGHRSTDASVDASQKSRAGCSR